MTLSRRKLELRVCECYAVIRKTISLPLCSQKLYQVDFKMINLLNTLLSFLCSVNAS
jgi:hypothetical protein